MRPIPFSNFTTDLPPILFKLGEAPGEVFAAIAMAMHEMQSDVHDVEETVLTITRVKRSYSPWSSKIYTLRETPHKK